MGVKLVALVCLVVVFIGVNVDAKPVEKQEEEEQWDILENETEEDFKKRCLLLKLGLAGLLASKFVNQQQQPQYYYYYYEDQQPIYYDYEFVQQPESIEFIYVDLYMGPDGQYYYQYPDGNGNFVEVLYPMELIRHTEFRSGRPEPGRKEPAEARVKRTHVMEYDARQKKEEAEKAVQPVAMVRPPPQQIQIRPPTQPIQYVQQPQRQVVQQPTTQQRPVQYVQQSPQPQRVVVPANSLNRVPAGATVYAVKRSL